MKFELSSAKIRFSDEEKIRYEALGFQFERREGNEWRCKNAPIIIELNSLDELIEFIRRWGAIIMDENEITIYDDFIE